MRVLYPHSPTFTALPRVLPPVDGFPTGAPAPAVCTGLVSWTLHAFCCPARCAAILRPTVCSGYLLPLPTFVLTPHAPHPHPPYTLPRAVPLRRGGGAHRRGLVRCTVAGLTLFCRHGRSTTPTYRPYPHYPDAAMARRCLTTRCPYPHYLCALPLWFALLHLMPHLPRHCNGTYRFCCPLPLRRWDVGSATGN